MTRAHPLHRIGLAILVAELAHVVRMDRDANVRRLATYRLRLLYPAVRMTDEKLETHFDKINRELPSPDFRLAHAQCVDILQHALESYPGPELDDDVAA
ncbi:hypothetical protein [Devosia sp. 1566]|uniref:hypothetical protein n=1 Tax=Devosia sp. 1566 TaxID=2499144 RepID=UPI000FDADBA1|nr:hypothetical protein [Devosia sp. 1566]